MRLSAGAKREYSMFRTAVFGGKVEVGEAGVDAVTLAPTDMGAGVPTASV